jgi:glucosaminylphosphatidylinositol acyltransferase
MDIGVGAFVLASAIVSREARSCISSSDAMPSPVSSMAALPNVVVDIMCKLAKMAPLLVFGGLRVVSHSFVNYPLHPSEYGVHWYVALGVVHEDVASLF